MDQIKLNATVRQEKGKQAVNRLRRAGIVPGIVYHRGEEAVSIALAKKDLNHIVQTAGGENVLINLTIEKEKKKSRSVIIKEIQQDPVKRNILHVDFNEISLTEQIIVEVEVVGVGESIGVKQEGGVLDHPLRMLRIQCLPTDIPKHIDVDISNLKLNGSIHVRDLVGNGRDHSLHPDKIKIMNDPELVLFQVKLHVEEKVEEVAATAPELEVTREKKEEEAPKGGAEKAKEEPKKQ